MASIFPQGGTDSANTQGGAAGLNLVELCQALFYRVNCNPRFDPLATNAIITELVKAINTVRAYDCNRDDNLAMALKDIMAFAGAELKDPDADDVIAGVFDGVRGIATVASILALAPMLFPEAPGPATANDWMSFFNTEAGRNERVKFSDFKNQLAPLPYTGDDKDNRDFPLRTFLMVDTVTLGGYGGLTRNQVYPVYLYPDTIPYGYFGYTISNYFAPSEELRLVGDWAVRGGIGFSSSTDNDNFALMERIR
jgi:hypothetical protein